MRSLTLRACAYRFFDTFLLIVPFYTVMFSDRGLTPSQIGIALAAWSATGLVLEIPMGILADRFSRRWLLFSGQTVRALGFVVWMLVPSFWGFLLGFVLWGVKSATQSGTFEALVYDEVTAQGRQEEYVRVIARAQSARFTGVLTASLLAAAAVGTGYPMLIAASAVAGATAAGLALLLPAAPRALSMARRGYLAQLRLGVSHAARLPGVAPLLVFIAGLQSIAAACADYWQLFARKVGLPAPGIALFIAALSASGVAAAALAHRMREVPIRRLYGFVIIAGIALVAGAATFEVWSIIFPMVFVFCYWLVDVNTDARFQHAIVQETRATVASVKGFATQLSTTILLLSFGLIAQAGDYRLAFLTYGIGMTLLGVTYGAWSLRPARPASPGLGGD